MVELNSILALVIAYVLGSIPSAVWVAKWFFDMDIREHGSKNAGLTNVVRVLGFKPAIPVCIIDFAKGFFAPFIAIKIVGTDNVWIPIIAGILAIVGHSFTFLAGFKGGKGVLTAYGVFTALTPVEASLALAIWLTITFTTRYVSLASIVAFLAFWALSLWSFIDGGIVGAEPIHWGLFVMISFATFFVIFKHKSNIQRLLNGTENRFSRDKKVTDSK